jgi:hypothetical protein
MFDVDTVASLITVRFAGHPTDVQSRIRLNAFISNKGETYAFTGSRGAYILHMSNGHYKLDPVREDCGKTALEVIMRTNKEYDALAA